MPEIKITYIRRNDPGRRWAASATYPVPSSDATTTQYAFGSTPEAALEGLTATLRAEGVL